MALLENLEVARSAGPTVLSRRPVARLSGSLSDPARLAALWPRLLPAIEQAIAAIEFQDLVLESAQDAAAGREALASLPRQIDEAQAVAEVGRLLAATGLALMSASRAPRGAWGAVDPKGGRFLAYLDDWMQGVALVALDRAAQLVETAAASPEDSLETTAKDALAKVRDKRVDGFFYPLVRIAEEQAIPWRILSTNDMIVVYGQGQRQRWVRGTLLDSQSNASVHITLRKDLTSRLLSRAGFPVPEFQVAHSREQAEAAARQLGFPLVVKPVSSSRAENVHLWLSSEADVGAAYTACGEQGTVVMVERQAEGTPYRISVLGGRALAAARHALPYVIGDGRATVDELIEARDAQARLPVPDKYARYTLFNREFYGAQLARCLEAQGLTTASILEAGRELVLGDVPQRRNGGWPVDVTDRVHPGLVRMAEDVAEVLGTPMLGLDLITTDITKPPGTVPLVINEVNSAPGLRAHEQPERQRAVATAAMETVFPAGDQGRIPIAAFYRPADAAPLDALESRLAAAGMTAGVADPRAARIDGFVLRPRTSPSAHPGTAVLRDRRADAAVFALDDADLISRGVPSSHVDVVAFPAIPMEEDGRTRRLAMRRLASLPGRLLLTPLGAEVAWLRNRCPHRRWIRLAAPGQDATELEAVAAAGGEAAYLEGNGKSGLRVLLLGPGRRDELADAIPPEAAQAELWALAALLGMGFTAAGIRKLTSAREARHGVPA